MMGLGRTKKVSDDGMELSILRSEEAKGNADDIEYEYKDFKWKDPFTKVKYIRSWPAYPMKGCLLTDTAWWIQGIALTVAVAWMTIRHDQIVEVCSQFALFLNQSLM